MSREVPVEVEKIVVNEIPVPFDRETIPTPSLYGPCLVFDSGTHGVQALRMHSSCIDAMRSST
jgi:hypothetical protein